jgi:hypothetical protein
MKTSKLKTFWLIVALMVISVSSCKYFINADFRKNYSNVNEAIHSDSTKFRFFKIHLKNGDVGVLEEWNLNKNKDYIIGKGKLYDFNRNQIKEGSLAFEIDKIAIIETNQLNAIKSKDQQRIAALSILSGANIALNLVCLINPKACFGSCPTFYVEGNKILHSANAEGFSSSIAPSLEKLDVDALQYSTSADQFLLTMKNEAFETHAVNKLSIDAVRKNKSKAIYHDHQGRYYQCDKLFKPGIAWADNKEIQGTLSRIDDQEYFSSTDSTNLSAKEDIILEYVNVPESKLGMVINYRQTLLTTFLLYSGISYMGDEVGDYFAKIETNNLIKQKLKNPFKRLGAIKIYVWEEDNAKWKFIESIYETGPIAKNLILVPVRNAVPKNGKLKIKLEMTKGLWRLDFAALTAIESAALPVTVQPSELTVINGENYTADAVCYDDKNYLMSFPGNEFKFKFDLPALAENEDYELFLSSKGYYLEWIRQEWLKGKNLTKLKKMITNDEPTWKELAREFKTMEKEMETVFWNSKYSLIQ